MKPNTVEKILLLGVVPFAWAGIYLTYRFGGSWAGHLIFATGFAIGASYTSLSVQLIEWSARRHKKNEK